MLNKAHLLSWGSFTCHVAERVEPDAFQKKPAPFQILGHLLAGRAAYRRRSCPVFVAQQAGQFHELAGTLA
jgi:hypothetical protein